MFNSVDRLFESEDNKVLFQEICEKLKNHPFDSPWQMLFPEAEETDTLFCGIKEIDLPEMELKEIMRENSSSTGMDVNMDVVENEEVNLISVKHSILKIKETNSIIENLEGVELILTAPNYQVQELCHALNNEGLSDAALASFLNVILKSELSLSLSVVTSLASLLIYPKVSKKNSKISRQLLLTISNFCAIYPKTVVDEVIIPCLKQEILEILQMEVLVKMSKSNLPAEYVSYCIKSVIEHGLPLESTFCVLQTLLERKVYLDHTILDTCAWKMEAWSSSFKKNIKFIKLIIEILKIYGSELSPEQISKYENIIKENETIMKKAAENALKKTEKL